MKKIIISIVLLCGMIFAEESCYISIESGHPKICDTEGYICRLGVDVGSQSDAMFFYLGMKQNCSNLFKSSNFNTTIVRKYIDENGTEHFVSNESPSTKFFLVNDGNLAGPLSMTVAGSFALAAYDNSKKVHIIYKQVSNVEHSGVRIISISYTK